MAGFTRRFQTIPTQQVIQSIEGLVLIDLVPPPQITGAGTGAILLVGEFEDGPFATDTDQDGVLEVFGSADYVSKYGSFGYEYDGVVSQNPSARQRAGELWNGNGFLKSYLLSGTRLFVARADTSVGEVAYSPLACLGGTRDPRALSLGDALSVTTGTGTSASDAVAGQVATAPGSGASFASITAGDTFGVSVDGGTQINVIFSATDTTVALAITRVNLSLGYTAAVINGSEMDISGRVIGRSGSLSFVEVTPGVLAKVGQIEAVTADVGVAYGTTPTLGTIAGTEEFSIDLNDAGPVTISLTAAPSMADVVALINTTVGTVVAFEDAAGFLRLQAPSGTNLGIDVGTVTGSSLVLAEVTGTPLVTNLGHVPGTFLGTGNVDNIDSVTAAEAVQLVNNAAATTNNHQASLGPDGAIRICATTPGSSIEIVDGTMAILLDFVTDTEQDPGDHGGGQILAGSRVRNGSGLEFVTMQTQEVPDGEVGPFIVKVRHGFDDGTGIAASASTVTVVVDQPEFAFVTVTNPAGLTVALTEPQMDNAYTDALAITLQRKLPSAEANYLLIARRTDAVVRDGISNVNSADTEGLLGRKYITGAPLGTDPSDTTAPFISGAVSRTDKMFYTVLGLKVRVPNISEIGAAGGLGFTADGIITVRPDGPATTICATLPPENNPGEATGLIEQFFEVDDFGNTLAIETYTFFKAQGFMAPLRGLTDGMAFQSGVTSSLNPSRLTAARRKMADFILDSFQQVLPLFIKKLNTQVRRDNVRSAMETFLSGLESEQNPELARIEGYNLNDGMPPNTLELRAAGVHIVEADVRTLASMDNIVIQATIGEGVVIEEA